MKLGTLNVGFGGSIKRFAGLSLLERALSEGACSNPMSASLQHLAKPGSGFGGSGVWVWGVRPPRGRKRLGLGRFSKRWGGPLTNLGG